MAIRMADLGPTIKYLRPYKQAILTAAVFTLVGNLSQLAVPVIYGKVIDLAVAERTIGRDILMMLALWVFIVFGGDWFDRRKSRMAAEIAYKTATDIIVMPLAHLLSLPLSFHKSKKIGEIVQRFTRADHMMYQLVESGLFEVAPSILTAFAAFAIIAWIQWQLAVIYVLFIFAYFILTFVKTEPIIENQKKLNRVFEKAYGDLFDRTPNIVSIKSNSMEEAETERNWKNFNGGLKLYTLHMTMWLKLSVWQRLLFVSSFIILFVAGISYVQLGRITIGQFVMMLAYINILSTALTGLGGHYKQLQEGIVTINRADEIFKEIPEAYEEPKAQILENPRGAIEFKNVSFSYEKEKVLDGISFRAAAGQMVAIVGKSGEGKTTLVDLISRYNVPQKGQILLDGTDIAKLKLKSLRDAIAIVPQEIDLFNDTIKNNIGYSKIGATDAEIRRAAKLAHCHEFIAEFPKKYEQIVGEKGVKLSTGQKQRVAIARAILRDPKILILDEATSALDSESEKYVQEALHEVMQNRTTFVIAHRLSTIRRADLILVLEDGKIVESGDHAELISKGGVYQKLSELQKISV